MPDVKFDSDLCVAPFMGDAISPSAGLNPLGYRTPSERLFTMLLPGMNVVSLRIRYYSFYCWLLKDFYASRSEARTADLRRHIRMSELLMAMIHSCVGMGSGVPGITRADAITGQSRDYIDFTEDAMPGGVPSGGYWKQSFGIFGTYYAASLQEIGLIRPLRDNDRLYNITPVSEDFVSGEALADAFASSVGDDKLDLFRSCASSGCVTGGQLDSLAGTFISRNLEPSLERDLLTRMLLQRDIPEIFDSGTMRRDTTRLLLEYIRDNGREKFSEMSFAKYAYDAYRNGSLKGMTALGWYAYYLNDSRQYQALVMFDTLLDRLLRSEAPGGWEEIASFTEHVAADVCDEFGAVDKTLGEVSERIGEIAPPQGRVARAFYELLGDYRANRDMEKMREDFLRSFPSVKGDAIGAFSFLEEQSQMPFAEFVKCFLAENIIYTHYWEAMRKYSQNRVATHKLIIENGCVKGLARYDATHSSPRVNTLMNFVTDLGLVDGVGLTDAGRQILEELKG